MKSLYASLVLLLVYCILTYSVNRMCETRKYVSDNELQKVTICTETLKECVQIWADRYIVFTIDEDALSSKKGK